MAELQAKGWTVLNNLLHQHNKWVPWTVIKSRHTAVREEKRQIQVARTARKKKGIAKLWQKQVQSQLIQSVTQTRGVKKKKPPKKENFISSKRVHSEGLPHENWWNCVHTSDNEVHVGEEISMQNATIHLLLLLLIHQERCKIRPSVALCQEPCPRNCPDLRMTKQTTNSTTF